MSDLKKMVIVNSSADDDFLSEVKSLYEQDYILHVKKYCVLNNRYTCILSGQSMSRKEFVDDIINDDTLIAVDYYLANDNATEPVSWKLRNQKKLLEILQH